MNKTNNKDKARKELLAVYTGNEECGKNTFIVRDTLSDEVTILVMSNEEVIGCIQNTDSTFLNCKINGDKISIDFEFDAECDFDKKEVTFETECFKYVLVKSNNGTKWENALVEDIKNTDYIDKYKYVGWKLIAKGKDSFYSKSYAFGIPVVNCDNTFENLSINELDIRDIEVNSVVTAKNIFGNHSEVKSFKLTRKQLCHLILNCGLAYEICKCRQLGNIEII